MMKLVKIWISNWLLARTVIQAPSLKSSFQVKEIGKLFINYYKRSLLINKIRRFLSTIDLNNKRFSFRDKIKIEYSTSENSTALQWLPPEQTAGKTHPYMFSQCQAIHCRSMVPCQDTPSVKSPYSAEVILLLITINFRNLFYNYFWSLRASN